MTIPTDERFLTVLFKLVGIEGKDYTLQFPTWDKASSSRQKIHSYRARLRDQGHPMSLAADCCVFKLEPSSARTPEAHKAPAVMRVVPTSASDDPLTKALREAGVLDEVEKEFAETEVGQGPVEAPPSMDEALAALGFGAEAAPDSEPLSEPETTKGPEGGGSG